MHEIAILFWFSDIHYDYKRCNSHLLIWEVCDVLLVFSGPSSLFTNSCPALHDDVVIISENN